MPLQIIKGWMEVEKVIQETPDTKTLRIRLVKPIDFVPGQFVMAGLEISDEIGPEKSRKDLSQQSVGKKLVKRAFSIASPPTQKEHIDLTFNINPGGQLSPFLYSLKEGSLVYIEGPYGKFNFNHHASKHHVFLGAGTGITPLMSMIRFANAKGLPEKKTLIYSVKTPDHIVYKKELLEMEKNKSLELFITITRPENVEWKGLTGRIDAKMISESVGDLSNAVFYMCGPPEMVENTLKILEDLGVPKEKINREQW